MESVLFSQLKVDFLSNDESSSKRDYGTFLYALDEFRLLTPSKNEAVVKQQLAAVGAINALLTDKNDRKLEGMCLLKYFAEQCSGEIFTENCTHWTSALTKIVADTSAGSHNSLTTRQASLVLVQCIRRMISFPEAARNFSLNVLPAFFSALFDTKGKGSTVLLTESVLDVVACCLRYFSGSCSQFKTKIENRILPCFDSHSEAVKVSAGLCFAQCARCSRGGSAGEDKHSIAWQSQTEKVICALQEVLNQLFEDLEVGTVRDECQQVLMNSLPALPLAPVTSAEPGHTCSLQHRYAGLSTALRSLLLEDFETVVKLPVDDILALVCHALGILPRFLCARSSPQRMRLLAVLPLIHQETLLTLGALVRVGRGCLIPYASTINGLLLQTLHAATSATGTPFGGMRPFGDLRCTIYSVTVLWLQELGAACGMDALNVCTDLIQQILTDVQPIQSDVVTLDSKRPFNDKTSMLMSAGPSAKKRKRNGGGDAVSSGSSLGVIKSERGREIVDEGASTDVCIAALKVLRAFLVSCGACMPASQYHLVLDFCLPLTVTMQRQHSPTQISAPYGDARCRLALYGVIRSAAMTYAPGIAPPIDLITKLFSSGLCDVDLDVRSFCRESGAICENVIHAKRGVVTSVTPMYATGGTNRREQEYVVNAHHSNDSSSSLATVNYGNNRTVVTTSQAGLNSDKDGVISEIGHIVSDGTSISLSTSSVTTGNLQMLANSLAEAMDVERNTRMHICESKTLNDDDDDDDVEDDDDDDVGENVSKPFTSVCGNSRATENIVETDNIKYHQGNEPKKLSCGVPKPSTKMVSAGGGLSAPSRELADEPPSSDLELMLQSFVDADAD